MVPLLHIFHFPLLHLLWDDVTCYYSRLPHCFNHFIDLLFLLESLLWVHCVLWWKILVRWKWFYWFNSICWTLYGLIAAQLGDVDSKMNTIEGKYKNTIFWEKLLLGSCILHGVHSYFIFFDVSFSIETFNFQI